jgi:hypothetical protein
MAPWLAWADRRDARILALVKHVDTIARAALSIIPNESTYMRSFDIRPIPALGSSCSEVINMG